MPEVRQECRAECWAPYQHVLCGHLWGLHKGRAEAGLEESPLVSFPKVCKK